MKNKNDIHVSLDGQHINFDFNVSTRIVSVPVSLQMGGNNLTIEAENESGSDIATAELIRSGMPPKIHFTNRSESTSLKNPEEIFVNSRISVIGYISNFDGANLSVLDNGEPINFSYNPSNGTFSGSLYITNNMMVKLTFQHN